MRPNPALWLDIQHCYHSTFCSSPLPSLHKHTLSPVSFPTARSFEATGNSTAIDFWGRGGAIYNNTQGSWKAKFCLVKAHAFYWTDSLPRFRLSFSPAPALCTAHKHLLMFRCNRSLRNTPKLNSQAVLTRRHQKKKKKWRKERNLDGCNKPAHIDREQRDRRQHRSKNREEGERSSVEEEVCDWIVWVWNLIGRVRWFEHQSSEALIYT